VSRTFTFEIEFKSDFHIGAGHGLGTEVDSALSRDPDGMPVIRGTILTGLLRDSLRQLLLLDPCKAYARHHPFSADKGTGGVPYCGQFGGTGEPCPLCTIFGSPKHLKQWRISSARPVGLEAPQQRDVWKAGETAAQSTTRLRVNPRTRRAEENKLFTREEGNGHLRFRFQAECRAVDDASESEAAWLVAAARLTRQIGASKGRGRGECEITLVDEAQQAALLGVFEQLLKGEKPLANGAGKQAAILDAPTLALGTSHGEHPYRLRVLLRADEPLLIARRAEAGNQFETLESIPGSVLRGALAWRVAWGVGEQRMKEGHAEYDTFTALFFRDAIRFSALFPFKVNDEFATSGHPTLRAPKDLLTCELHPGYTETPDEGHGVLSAVCEASIPKKCPVRGEGKLEAVRAYLPLDGSNPTVGFTVRQRSEMHIRIEPRTGRVSRGDLYGYVALEPGQYWIGEIHCANEQVWQTLCALARLEAQGINSLRLGKASRRGYGKVTLHWAPSAKSVWLDARIEQRVRYMEAVVMTLLSDAIVADLWGRFVRGFDEGWLQQALDLPETASVTVDEQRRFSAVRPVDGFNATLGLPRARDIALEAGSTVRLSFSGIELEPLREKLAKVEQEGIGLRRDEGFGRVAFNHPIHQEPQQWPSITIHLNKELEALQLGRAASADRQAKRDQFLTEWGKTLDEQTLNWWKERFGRTPKNRTRFEAVARFLHTTQLRDVAAIRAELQAWGQSDQLLPQKVHNEVKHGRGGENFFDSERGEGKKGIEALDDLLQQLADTINANAAENGHDRLCQVGLQMLAGRISAVTREQEGSQQEETQQ